MARSRDSCSALARLRYATSNTSCGPDKRRWRPGRKRIKMFTTITSGRRRRRLYQRGWGRARCLCGQINDIGVRSICRWNRANGRSYLKHRKRRNLAPICLWLHKNVRVLVTHTSIRLGRIPGGQRGGWHCCRRFGVGNRYVTFESRHGCGTGRRCLIVDLCASCCNRRLSWRRRRRRTGMGGRKSMRGAKLLSTTLEPRGDHVNVKNLKNKRWSKTHVTFNWCKEHLATPTLSTHRHTTLLWPLSISHAAFHFNVMFHAHVRVLTWRNRYRCVAEWAYVCLLV